MTSQILLAFSSVYQIFLNFPSPQFLFLNSTNAQNTVFIALIVKFFFHKVSVFSRRDSLTLSTIDNIFVPLNSLISRLAAFASISNLLVSFFVSTNIIIFTLHSLFVLRPSVVISKILTMRAKILCFVLWLN